VPSINDALLEYDKYHLTTLRDGKARKNQLLRVFWDRDAPVDTITQGWLARELQRLPLDSSVKCNGLMRIAV
jgi:hypothetical protein